MSTLIRPEISKRKEEWISKHRYYELKHFCLQYPEWKKIVNSTNYIHSSSVLKPLEGSGIEFIDPTFDNADRISRYLKKMQLVETAAKRSSLRLSNYILKAVTNGISWNHLKYVEEIPCERGEFYRAYRKFFFELDKLKQE